jgi:hypothetical protein
LKRTPITFLQKCYKVHKIIQKIKKAETAGGMKGIKIASRDKEIIRKLFGDLNRGLLGPLSDDSVIILSNSDEEKEVREDNCADVEVVPSSTRISPASTADDDDAPDEVQDDSSDDGDEAKRGVHGRALKNLRIAMILQCCTTNSSIKENEDDGAVSWRACRGDNTP